MAWLTKLLCRLGYHGPNWFGIQSTLRSERIGPRLRQCRHCKTQWIGEELATNSPSRVVGWSESKTRLPVEPGTGRA